MLLKEILFPIESELEKVKEVLSSTLRGSKNKHIHKINRYLSESQGKMLRPALVILSARATARCRPSGISQALIKSATAMELIHIASLIHDDVIDKAPFRHNRPTINRKFGEDISVALGDYFYSLAFEIISHCGKPDIVSCISSATKAMCEGELIQVCERDNLNLLKKRYIIIAKKKTASLFIASCQAGAIISSREPPIQHTLKEYGLNFGIAFQIMDDYLDLIGRVEDLGKSPGADFKMGELTLPVLNLLTQAKDKSSLISLIRRQDSPEAFNELKQRFINSRALLKTKEDVCFYAQEAKKGLNSLRNSCFKQSLFNLADYLANKMTL